MPETKFNPAYIGPRPDVEALVSLNARLVLDVGCSNGVAGLAIKRRTGAKIVGIEISPEMAAEANTRLDRVIIGDVSEIFNLGVLTPYRFDSIIFADVLEHLVDPWQVLLQAKQFLSSDGVIIASIPNIRHIDTLYNLFIRGYWPYRDRGIHDRTHLRFFTRKNIAELFEGAGLQIEEWKANYRLIEKPHDLNRYSYLFARFFLRDILTFQYVVRAKIPTT